MKKSSKNLLNRRVVVCAVSATFGLTAMASASAETEVEDLKRELAAQRQLIDKLLAGQESQKQINSKVESQVAAAGKPSSMVTASGVTFGFYGIADVNVTSMNSGFGSKVTYGSGGFSSSRLGFTISKPINDDLKAVALGEAGLLYDTGTAGNASVTNGINNTSPSSGGQAGTGPQLFSRQMYAGLSGNFGTATIGRQYTGSYLAAVATGAAKGDGLFGYSGSITPLIGGMPTRLNNSIVYITPKVKGFYGYFTGTSGSENNVNAPTAVGTATTTDKAGRGYDLGIFYTNNAFNAALTTWNLNNASWASAGESGLANKTGWQFAANYDFGVIRLYGNVVSGTISGGNYENVSKTLSSAHAGSLSFLIPFGKHNFSATYTKLVDESILNKSANLVGVSYWYDLLKDAKLYVSYGKMQNNANATYSLADGGNLVGNVTKPGFDPSGVVAGVNFAF
ncbi:MAG: porin [Dechloromonas sp.]|nr:MAG: porin [Dechloromonas sp.]MBU2434563.1 porin [Gammaproteobacteria bacterium]MBU2451600.1 porin [Gammaproteobacteria bacterium]TXT30785.1 MAG: hypothetical protein FD131_1471 [Rhodocyclaceae bacterium]